MTESCYFEPPGNQVIVNAGSSLEDNFKFP